MDITRAVSAVLRREGVGSGGNAPGTGALPIRLFVLNPLWGFNCKLMDQKELSSQIGEERGQPALPFILLPRERVSTNTLRTSERPGSRFWKIGRQRFDGSRATLPKPL